MKFSTAKRTFMGSEDSLQFSSGYLGLPEFWKVGETRFRKKDCGEYPQYLNYDRFIQPIPESLSRDDLDISEGVS